MNRRTFLRSSLVTAAVVACLPACAGIVSQSGPRLFAASGAASFDFYISTTGTGTASGGGSFADPWPITMISNATAQARYAGKVVGLKDGTYDLTGISNGGGRQAPQLAVASGSSGSPTVIQAVNARMAILQMKTGGGTRTDHPAIGQETSTGGWVTLKNLVIYGSSYCGASFYYTSEQQPGVVVDGCEIYDIDRQALDTDNTPGVWVSGCLNALIDNCYLHDCKTGSNGHNGAGVLSFGNRGTLVTRTTIKNCGSAVYSKHSSSHAIPDEGCSVTYCYIEACKSVFTGFDNADYTGVYDKSTFAYNVIDNSSLQTSGLVFPDLGPTYHIQSPFDVYNNSVYLADFNNGGWALSANTSGALLNIYNNIMSRSSTPGYRSDILVRNIGEIVVLDYNTYYTTSTRLWGIGSGDSPSSTYSTLAAWRTALGGGTTTSEQNSSTTDPGFVLTGSGPSRFKRSGTPNDGKVGGVAAGATVNRGAYASSGQTEQIGHNF